MGRLNEFIRSIFGFPNDRLGPNDLPRDIYHDFQQEFGHNFGHDHQSSGHFFNHPPGGDWFPPQDQQMPDEFIIFQGGPEDMPDMFAEMEEMFNNFFQGFGPNGGLTPPEFFSGPGIGGMISPPGDGHSGETESITQGESLRDRMLKHPQQGSGSHENQSPSPNKETEKPPGSGLPHSWFGDFWNLPFGGTSQPQDNIDKDFDSELEKGEQTLDDILKPGHRPKLQSPLRSFSSSSSITSFNSNGKSESKVTRRDSRGNEEVIITRQLGDRKHIIRHFVDETGSRQIEENFVNMNSAGFVRVLENLEST